MRKNLVILVTLVSIVAVYMIVVTNNIQADSNIINPTFNITPPASTSESDNTLHGNYDSKEFTPTNKPIKTCEFYEFEMAQKYAKQLEFPSPPTEWRACKEIAQKLLEQKIPEELAPKDFPLEWKDAYTLNGTVALKYEHYKNIYNGKNTRDPVWTVEEVDGIRAKVVDREKLPSYPMGTLNVYQAMDKWSADSIKGKNGVVIGSQTPWMESILLEYGANHITTIEYGKIISQHPQISTMLPSQSYQLLLEEKWEPLDFAVSYSSIEHSGLGRYGDPLDPFGDLEALQQVACLIKPGGFFFLGVPVGPDCLVFNAHRIVSYGPKRLSLVFKGWHVLDMATVNPLDLVDHSSSSSSSSSSILCKTPSQPVFVMQNLRGCA